MAVLSQKPGWLNAPLSIESVRILGGANYFSGGKVVLMRLNLGVYNEVKTDAIPQFYDALKTQIPSLYEHFCSPGHIGGFLERVQEGTLLGHVAEHIAIEVQTLAGMDVFFGKTRESKDPGVFNVVFRYFTEPCGILAGQLAVQIINSILLSQPFDHLPFIEEMVQIRKSEETILRWDDLIDAAERMHIPVLWEEATNTVTFGSGKHCRSINLQAGLIHEWLLKYLFPDPNKSRIPLISVTGSYGKSELVSALYQCLKTEYRTIGVSLASGLYKNAELISLPTASNRAAVHHLITDPELDCGILETSLADVTAEGLPYDLALIGVVLGVKGDHSTACDLTREDDIAYAKSVVAEQVLSKGYAILNADDPLVMDMTSRLDCRIIYYTQNQQHPLLGKLKTNSKQSIVYLEDQSIIYLRMGTKHHIIDLGEVPASDQRPMEESTPTLLALSACLIGLKWQPEKIALHFRSLQLTSACSGRG